MLCEFVATPAEWCVLAPKSLTSEPASTLPIAALTAWMALFETGHTHAGETIVVQGTGGVSLFAVQFAAVNGATVIVTTSSDQKVEQVKKLGAAHAINRRTTPEWEKAILDLTGGRGADHILEMAGGDMGRSLEAVRQGGRISLIGFLESMEMKAKILQILAKWTAAGLVDKS